MVPRAAAGTDRAPDRRSAGRSIGRREGDRIDGRVVAEVEAGGRGDGPAPEMSGLLEAKMHVPPRRRGLVRRARLARRLERDTLAAVVLVSAPAGFGKATLLTEALCGPSPPAWLSLDRRDSDPAVFWAYVIEALRKVEPTIGADALAALEATAGGLEAVVTALANELAMLDRDVVLVLDDYHVIESLEVHESVRFLLEHLPPPLHLVVASRVDPPWPLAGLRASGQLLEFRAKDLRFTSDEATAYLNDVM